MSGLYSGGAGLYDGASSLWGGKPGLIALVYTTILTGFDTGFNASPDLVYGPDDLIVERTTAAGGGQRVRGRTGHVVGKWYAELQVIGGGGLLFAGIVDATFRNRYGIEAGPGDIVRLAWNGRRLWTKRNMGKWNSRTGANPATGTGGLSTADLIGPAYIGATLPPIMGAGVRYRLPGDVGYVLPIGYTEWNEDEEMSDAQ